MGKIRGESGLHWSGQIASVKYLYSIGQGRTASERYKYLGFSNSGKARILSFQKCHTSTRCVGTLDFGPIFFRVLVVAPASLVIATTVAKATRFNPVYLQVLFSLNLYCVFILRIFQRAVTTCYVIYQHKISGLCWYIT